MENLKDFRDGLNEIGFPAVLKPLSGAGGKNVIKLDAAEEGELEKTFATLHRLSHPFYDPLFFYNPGKFLLEEYIEGDEVSIEGFVDGAEMVWETEEAEKLGKAGELPFFPEWT